MSSIDKTYTDSYKDYAEFVEWSRDKTVVFWTGLQERVSSYIYHYDDIKTEVPIMNSPLWLDAFLLKHCPVKFVTDRIREVYSVLPYNFSFDKPDDCKQNRRVKIIPLTTKTVYNRPVEGYYRLESEYMTYNDVVKAWTKINTHPCTFPFSKHKTIKSLVRFLRKQYLPVTEFELNSRYGEKYLVKIT